MLIGRKTVLYLATGSIALTITVATAQEENPPEPPMPRTSTGCPPTDAASPFKDLSEIQVGMRLVGKETPPDCSGSVFQGMRPSTSLSDSISEFHSAPANFFHQPLYFDDTPLERYGQSVSPHFQPFISGGRFFLALPIIPYKIGYDHPYECVTTLGQYRPGVCAPCVMQVPPPLQWNSALLQAGTTVGLVLLLP